MKLKPLATGATALTVLALAACQSPMPTAQAPSGGAPGACRADAAQALAGKDRVSDEQARQLTGATLVRQIAPGQPVTLDFRQERVTIETDPKTGKIVRAFCG